MFLINPGAREAEHGDYTAVKLRDLSRKSSVLSSGKALDSRTALLVPVWHLEDAFPQQSKANFKPGRRSSRPGTKKCRDKTDMLRRAAIPVRS